MVSKQLQFNYFLAQVRTMKFHSIGFLLATVSMTAMAQSPATVTPTVPPAPLAKHSCVSPAMPDATKSYTADESNAFVRTLETFRSCIQTFTEGQKVIVASKQNEAEALRQSAVDAFQAAKAAAAAADAAVKEYNNYSEQAIRIVTPKAQKTPDAPKKAAAVEPPAPKP